MLEAIFSQSIFFLMFLAFKSFFSPQKNQVADIKHGNVVLPNRQYQFAVEPYPEQHFRRECCCCIFCC